MKYSLNKFLLIIIGFSIVTYIIYIRVILERMPRDFTQVDPRTYFIFTISMLLLFSFSLIFTIIVYLKLFSTREESSVTDTIVYKCYIKTKHILISLIQLITTSLIAFDLFWKDLIPFSGNISEYIGRFLIKVRLSFEIISKVCIVIKLVIAITFVIELVFYKKLDYFYKELILLIIPLLHSYIVYTIRQWVKDQIECTPYLLEFELLDFNRIVPFETLVKFYCHCSYDDDFDLRVKFIFNKNYIEHWRISGKHVEEEKTFHMNFCYLICRIAYHLFCYDKYLEKALNNNIYTIMILSIYSVGWLYISIYLLRHL
jgi:hypothetical protein